MRRVGALVLLVLGLLAAAVDAAPALGLARGPDP